MQHLWHGEVAVEEPDAERELAELGVGRGMRDT
jgi:hypothetical protein